MKYIRILSMKNIINLYLNKIFLFTFYMMVNKLLLKNYLYCNDGVNKLLLKNYLYCDNGRNRSGPNNKYSKYFRYDRWVEKKIEYVMFDHIKLTFKLFHKMPKESFLRNSKFFKKLYYFGRFDRIDKAYSLLFARQRYWIKRFQNHIYQKKYGESNNCLYNILFIKPKLFKRKYPISSIVKDILKWSRYRVEKFKYKFIYEFQFIYAWFMQASWSQKFLIIASLWILFQVMILYPWRAFKEETGANEFEEFIIWTTEQQKPKKSKHAPLTIEDKVALIKAEDRRRKRALSKNI
jgi:hypothetical protein